MNNWRTVFWLALATLTAIAANVFLSWQKPLVRPLPSQTILDPTLAVGGMEISRPGARPIVFSKTDGWHLTAPYEGSVDLQAVLKMLDLFSTSTVEDVLTESELVKLGRTREDFGLEEPRLTVVFRSGASETEIAFGTETPMSNSVYAVKNFSGSVLVVPRELYEVAAQDVAAFRDRTVIALDEKMVTGLDLKRPGESPISFVREDGVWKVGGSVASQAKIRALLAQLRDARALSFVWPVGATNEPMLASASVLSGYGLDAESAMSVTVRYPGGSDRRILMGNDVDGSESYALIHGGRAVVTVDSALKTLASQNLRSFVDTRLFPVEESDVKSFAIASGETSYVLARTEGGAWRLDSPIAAPADSEAVSLLLGRILSLTPTDLQSDGLKVSVASAGPALFVSPESVLAGQSLNGLRSPDILRIDPTLVKRLVVSTGSRVEAVVYSRERRTWSEDAAEGASRPVDKAAVAAILEALSTLKAERIVALKASASDLAAYGLESPRQTLSVDQDRAGSVRRNLLIGKAAEDGRYATVGSAEAVFVLSEKTVEVLTASLIGE